MSQCEVAFEKEDFESAVVLCAREAAQHNDADLGVLGARAAGETGGLDAFEAYARRFIGTVTEGDILRQAGVRAWRNGSRDRAEALFARAAQIYRRFEEPARLGQALYNLHYAAWSRSDHDPALRHAQAAFELAARAKDSVLQVNALVGLASIYEETGMLEAARNVLEEAATRVTDDNATGKFTIANSRGVVELQAERFALALGYFKDAAALLNDVPQRLHQRVHLNQISALLGLERYAQAEEQLIEAQALARDGQVSFVVHFYSGRIALAQERIDKAMAAFKAAAAGPELPDLWRWEILYWQGRAAEASGDLVSAEHFFGAAVEAVENAADHLGVGDLSAYLIDAKQKPFASLFLLQISQGRPYEALQTIERAKASIITETALRDSLANLTAESDLDAIRDAPDFQAVQGLLPRMRRAVRRSAGDFNNFGKNQGEFAALVYFQAEEKLWPILLDNGAVTVSQTPVALAMLATLIAEVLEKPHDHAAQRALGAALLPADVTPASGRRLVVVTDPAIRRVAFAGLRIGDTTLIERHVISFIPNLTWLSQDHSARSNAAERIVIADPLSDLPAARIEGEMVSRLTGARTYLGPDARRQAISPGARLVHFATHTGANATGPWLALADGRMDAAAVADAGRPPETVVLATCASAQTRTSGYWGSIAGAFLAAGSREVVATLYSIDDAQTSVLMDWFYQELGDDAALAVATTQRRAIRAGLPEQSWSGLVVLAAPP